jgi:hypothetical protein
MSPASHVPQLAVLPSTTHVTLVDRADWLLPATDFPFTLPREPQGLQCLIGALLSR